MCGMIGGNGDKDRTGELVVKNDAEVSRRLLKVFDMMGGITKGFLESDVSDLLGLGEGPEMVRVAIILAIALIGLG